MPNIGPLEIGVLLVVALVVFGPKRLPQLGSSLGRGIRGFRQSLDGKDDPPQELVEAPVAPAAEKSQAALSD